MDLHTVRDYQRPSSPDAVEGWKAGTAWLAGGTWLFSEPQVHLDTLLDIHGFGWPPLTVTADGLEIAATCRIAELEAFSQCTPADWTAARLFTDCCHALLASFKIWNEATVGGNICLSLPAGAMISLTAALEGILTVWPRTGEPWQVPVTDFVLGDNRNLLQPGDLLRSISIPASALRKSYVMKRFSLTAEGRSSILVIGTRCPAGGEFVLTITASTPRPIQLKFPSLPPVDELHTAIDTAVPADGWFDDVHGSPAHRRHMTHYYAAQILGEL